MRHFHEKAMELEILAQVYLIDYGLAKAYRDSAGMHRPMTTGKTLIGTACYASINAHEGRELSRRDDLEALGYMLVYLTK